VVTDDVVAGAAVCGCDDAAALGCTATVCAAPGPRMSFSRTPRFQPSTSVPPFLTAGRGDDGCGSPHRHTTLCSRSRSRSCSSSCSSRSHTRQRQQQQQQRTQQNGKAPPRSPQRASRPGATVVALPLTTSPKPRPLRRCRCRRRGSSCDTRASSSSASTARASTGSSSGGEGACHGETPAGGTARGTRRVRRTTRVRRAAVPPSSTTPSRECRASCVDTRARSSSAASRRSMTPHTPHRHASGACDVCGSGRRRRSQRRRTTASRPPSKVRTASLSSRWRWHRGRLL
jgi:hypothetical protein